MLQEEKYFNGAVQDSDNAIEYTQPNAISDGLNVRIQTQEGNKQGLVVTLEGNREIARTLPIGTNTVLRSKYFPEVGKAYIFTKNSNGLHRIEEFDVQSETFVTIFEDLTDSGSEQLLDWVGVLYIKDVVLIQGTLLYWTEFPNDVVRRVDVAKAKTDPLFNSDTFYISVPPPMYAPDVEYNSDSEYMYNNLTGNLFQFRYRLRYPNDEHSAWSPISERLIPTGEPLYPTSFKSFNAIRISVPYDPTKVITGIDIAARHNDSDWYTIKSVTREYIQGLPAFPTAPELNDPDDPQPIDPKEFLTPFTLPLGKYYYTFYNDALYPTDDQLEHDLLADYVPEATRAIESVNDNTILLGNNKLGKPRPDVSEDIALSVISNNPDAGGNISTFKVDWTATGFNAATDRNYNTIQFSGDPQEDDVVSIDIRASSGVITHSYTVPPSNVGNLSGTINAVAALFPPSFPASFQVYDMQVVSAGGICIMRWESKENSSQPYGLISAEVETASATSFNNSIPALKSGASYEIMAAFYDNKGRPFPLARVGTIKLPTYAETLGQYPTIGWSVTGTAPQGAKYFQLLSSLNKTHQITIGTVAAIDLTKTDADWLWLDITPLFDFNEQYPEGNLGYEWQRGDRLVPIAYFFDVGTGDSRHSWFRDNPAGNWAYDIEIVEYLFDNDQHLIRIRRPPNNVLTGETWAMQVEIYRKKATVAVGEEVYYEVTPTYQIDDSTGTYLQTSGEITHVDSFFKWRKMDFTLESDPIGFREFWAETFHFSDTIKSDYWNLGRPRTYYDTPEQSHFKSEIRHSREWISGSRVNGIVRFYPEDVYDAREPMYGASENYGGIQYLTNRENRLICLQELKVGYIPVNRSIIEDTLEQQQVGISSKLLNPITYSIGPNMGIGKDYAIPSYEYVNGAAYFIDPHEMLPVRAGLDGTRYIQSTYSGEMKHKIREMVTSGNYVFSVWDDRMNEWLVVFNDYTYVYDEKSNGWIPKRSYLPSSGFTANDRLYTTNGNGQLYIHDDESNRNRFYGTDYPAELKFPITSPRVKTYQSIALHMDDEVETVEDGIETQLGHVSDLVVDDFTWREGIRYANLLRDKNSGTDITNGDRLKGRWITLHLVQEAPVGEWNLIKAVCKSAISTNNE